MKLNFTLQQKPTDSSATIGDCEIGYILPNESTTNYLTTTTNITVPIGTKIIIPANKHNGTKISYREQDVSVPTHEEYTCLVEGDININKHWIKRSQTSYICLLDITGNYFSFSGIKEISIPEGKVKEISINGQVVWKMKPAGIIVKYSKGKTVGPFDVSISYVDADGTTKNLSAGDNLVPVGTQFKFYLYKGDGGGWSGVSYLYYNNKQIAEESGLYGSTTTKYITLNNNATIEKKYIKYSTWNADCKVYVNDL